jgi:sarcosine oxidase subunit gamma
MPEQSQSALSHVADRRPQIAEVPLLHYVNIRGRIEDGVIGAIGNSLNISLPVKPNTVADNGSIRAYWLGPDEWLCVSVGQDAKSKFESARRALAGLHGTVTDVSSGYTMLKLSGSGSADVLAKGCGLDLHSRAFGPGQCAQTLIAKCPVLIEHPDEFRIIVRRSYADYLWQWLLDAARQ